MTWRARTGLVITLVAVLLIVWDFAALSIDGSRATVSNVLLTLSYHHPAIPVFLGGLMTHLFWPGKTLGPGWLRVIIGAMLLVGLIVVGFLVPDLIVPPAASLLAGAVFGRVLVPQAEPPPEKRGVW